MKYGSLYLLMPDKSIDYITILHYFFNAFRNILTRRLKRIQQQETDSSFEKKIHLGLLKTNFQEMALKLQ